MTTDPRPRPEPDRDGPDVLRDTPDDAPAYQDAYEWETVTPRVTTEPDRDGLAALYAQHRWTWKAVTPRRLVLVCACGDELIPAASSGVATLDDHEAHLADVIRDHLRAVLGDEGLREAVAKQLATDNDPEVSALWLPDADAALAVVADRLGLGEA